MINNKKKVKNHMLFFKIVFIIGLIVVLAIVAVLVYQGVKKTISNHKETTFQNSINPFYAPPNPLPSNKPGSLIRSEKIDNLSVPGGSAYRILYNTQLPDGTLTVSSGMIFVPNTPAPEGGRKVVAWAHGTLGFGTDCVPSRIQNPELSNIDMANWLPSAMQRGWVVTATDYVGLGTPGTPYYLIGQSEAQDVINSVRAAQNFEPAKASNQYSTFGHSQGGHSSFFAAQFSQSYAPELNLIATAAAAPALELSSLFSQQYNQVVAWAIGPDASISWPLIYKDLQLDGVLSKKALKQYKKIAFGCIKDQETMLVIKKSFKEQFFVTDPIQNNGWANAAADQTPDISKINVPLYIVQSTSDIIVLPNTTALFEQKACAANKNLTVNWIGDTSHQETAMVGGTGVMDWLQNQFNGTQQNSNTCNQPSPIELPNSQ